MNIEQVNEALATSTCTDHPDSPDRECHVCAIDAAARQFVDGWETCPTCNGSGCRTWDGTGKHRKTYDCEVCPDCVDGMIPGPELVERSRFPVLDSIGMIASKWLRITHDEAMQRPDIQEAATIIAKAVLLASRREEQ